MITIEKIISWTIPLFGNKRIFAYGKLLVSDGKTRRLVTTKERQFIQPTFASGSILRRQ